MPHKKANPIPGHVDRTREPRGTRDQNVIDPSSPALKINRAFGARKAARKATRRTLGRP